MYTPKSRFKKITLKVLSKLWSVLKDVLTLAGNLTVIVITVIVIFTIARVVSPVDVVKNNEEEAVIEVIKSGVEADPIYKLVGKEIEGTINAYNPIDGVMREGVEADPYSKVVSNPKRYWDIHDEVAVGNPGYIRYGFLPFNQIVDLKTGDVLVFPNVNFGEETPEYISMQIAKFSEEGGTIAVYVDSIGEESLIAIFDVTEVKTGNGKTDFFPVIEKIGRGKAFTGVHKVYLQVEQEGVSIGEIRFGR